MVPQWSKPAHVPLKEFKPYLRPSVLTGEAGWPPRLFERDWESIRGFLKIYFLCKLKSNYYILIQNIVIPYWSGRFLRLKQGQFPVTFFFSFASVYPMLLYISCKTATISTCNCSSEVADEDTLSEWKAAPFERSGQHLKHWMARCVGVSNFKFI